MSAKNPIRLFVTHAFASYPDYHRVFEYLEASPNFFYRNCSVPDHPPAAGPGGHPNSPSCGHLKIPQL